MKDVVFITGNQKKADYFAELIGHPIEHVKVDLDEAQSLDLKEVVRHKFHQAYEVVKRPVLVEDVALECKAFKRLPGTFIRWFLEELGAEGVCRMLDNKDRSARARCVFGYYDGKEEYYFEGGMNGMISEHPGKEINGFGWDVFFIPEGSNKIRSELSEEEYHQTYLKVKPIEAIRKFLED